MAVAWWEVAKAAPTSTPIDTVDSLKQQVNALSVQINLLKAQVTWEWKETSIGSKTPTLSREMLNKIANQTIHIPHRDRKIEYKMTPQSASGQGIIELLDLEEIEMPDEDRIYYAVPLENKVFMKWDLHGFYYFEGINLIYIPDFKRDQSYPPVEHIFMGVDVDWNLHWWKRYPQYSLNILDYLNKQAFGDEIVNVSIKDNKKQIIYEKDKYYIKSFEHKTPIGLTILSLEWIVPWVSAEAIGTNIQLLSFQNFLSFEYFDSKKVEETQSSQFLLDPEKGIFLANKAGKLTFLVLEISQSPFFTGTSKTPVLPQYVKYLNAVFF